MERLEDDGRFEVVAEAANGAQAIELATVLHVVESVLQRDLPAEPQSASRARHALAAALPDAVSDDTLDTLVLA